VQRAKPLQWRSERNQLGRC